MASHQRLGQTVPDSSSGSKKKVMRGNIIINMHSKININIEITSHSKIDEDRVAKLQPL
jgi:hypothetical protein